MYIKNILFVILVVPLQWSIASPWPKFKDYINKNCTDVNDLTIKKAFFDLNNGENCNSVFVKKITESCTKISCNIITDRFQKIITLKPGAVVGDE